MKVVEIGCGGNPGPRLNAAIEHFAVEIDPIYIERLTEFDRGFIPVRADGKDLGMFPDGSADVVLYRNVLGDPNLGMNERELRQVEILKTWATEDGDLAGFREINQEVQVLRVAEKAGLIKEAVRIVKPAGEGVVVFVEDYTPEIAALDAPQVVSCLAEIGVNGCFQPLDLAAISDADYAASLLSDAQVWIWRGDQQAIEP